MSLLCELDRSNVFVSYFKESKYFKNLITILKTNNKIYQAMLLIFGHCCVFYFIFVAYYTSSFFSFY